MNKVFSNKGVIALYVMPALILILALVYIPIVQTGYFGLTKWNGMGAKEFIGLQNYITLIHDKLFWQSAGHSFILAAVSVVSLCVYLIISFVLASNIKGRDLLRKVYLIPMLLSSVAIGQLWAKIYDPTNGILNKFLSALGMHNTPAWLGDSKMALFALMIPIVWQYAGFYILIYYAALMDVSEEIIEAARIDGASQWRIALSVKFPLIMNVVKVTIVLALVGSLKYFDLIYIMTGGGPNGATEVMASYMYKTAFQDFNFGYASAIAFFFLIICLIVTYITRRITRADEDIY